MHLVPSMSGVRATKSPIFGAIDEILATSVSYCGQIPRRTLAFCQIQPFTAPNAGKLAGIIRGFRGYWECAFAIAESEESPIVKRIAPILLVLMIQSIAPAQSFKVMTYNILRDSLENISSIDQTNIGWNDPAKPRKERVRTILEQEDADLIGFQEVTDNQLPDLIDFLPGYDYVSESVQNVIFYKRDRYLLQDNGISSLPDGEHVVWAQLLDRNTNGSFVIGNTHLACCGQELERQLQATVIQQEMPAITNGLPLVFIGDLNFSPQSTGFSILTGQSGPQNFTLDDACGPFCGDAPTYPFGERIDHVLHTSEIVATNARVVTDLVDGLLPSDHFAVTADLLNTSAPIALPTQVQSTLVSGDIEDQIVWESGGSAFDGLGDGKGTPTHDGAVGATRRSTLNFLSRQVMKFDLPFIGVFETTVENATLRVFVEDLLGTLPEGLSVMHDVIDNDSEVLISHYEAPYVDTGLDLFVPQDGAGQYYDIDVTEFVKADYQSDGSDPWSAFRLELTNGEQFRGQTVAYIIGGSQLEITLRIVPEPTTATLALAALCLAISRRRISAR